MKAKVIDSMKKATSEDVEKVEKAIGVKLPDNYKKFILENNGGYPEPNAVPIQNNSSDNHALVENFMSVDEKDEYYYLPDCYKTLKDRIPSGFIPIAEDPGGNYFLLGLKEENKGKVYFWDHEGESSTPGMKNMYLSADTFDQFINSLSNLE